MMLPGIFRWSDAKVLDEAGAMLARLALGAADGDPHKNPLYQRLSQFPTRRRCEALFRLALTPDPDGKDGFKRGFSLDQLFAEAWDRVDADEGEDQGAKDLLVDYAERIAADGGDPDAAAKNLASFDPESLWVKFAQSAYPDFPQTPGSAKWNEAEAAGNPHETVDNPFLR